MVDGIYGKFSRVLGVVEAVAMFREGKMCNCLAYRMNYMTVSQCQYLQTSTTHYSIHLQTIPDLSLHFLPVLFELVSVAVSL